MAEKRLEYLIDQELGKLMQQMTRMAVCHLDEETSRSLLQRMQDLIRHRWPKLQLCG